jgi:ABC-type transport system involved in cytochrome bd biosynthesis fused ATPase/permease subunit
MDSKMRSPPSPLGRKAGLLKDQLQLVKRKEHDRYEIEPIQETLSFEKGLFMLIRASQLLAQKMEGVILVGLAGASGAGKTVFCEKLTGFMPGIATISMDNYNDASRLIDENYDGNMFAMTSRII